MREESLIGMLVGIALFVSCNVMQDRERETFVLAVLREEVPCLPVGTCADIDWQGCADVFEGTRTECERYVDMTHRLNADLRYVCVPHVEAEASCAAERDGLRHLRAFEAALQGDPHALQLEEARAWARDRGLRDFDPEFYMRELD